MCSKSFLSAILLLIVSIVIAVPATAAEVLLPEIEKKGIKRLKSDKLFSLKDAVSQALMYHPEVKRSQATIKFREEELRKSQSAFLPTLDFHGEYGRENTESNALDSAGEEHVTLWRRDTNLTLSQLLWDGRNVFAKKSRMQSLLEKSLEESNLDKEEVSLRVVNAYLDLLRTEKLIKIARENIKAHNEIAEIVQKRIDKNRAKKSEAGQVKGRGALAKASWLRQLRAYDTAVESFVEVVGFMPKKIEEEALVDLIKPANAQDALFQAMDKHPSLKAIAHSMKAQKHSIVEAKSTYQPQVYMRMSGEWNDKLDGFKGENVHYRAYLAMDYNLFRGGADKANIRSRYAALEEETEERSRLMLAIRRDLFIAWNDYKSSQMDYKFFTEHEEASLMTMEAFQEEYKAAQRTLFDLLNSKAEYFRSKESVMNAKYTAYKNSYRIIHAMGVLSDSIVNSKKLLASSKK